MPMIIILENMTRPLLLAFFLTFPLFATSSEAMMAYVQENLPHHGILRKTDSNFVYVKVDDAYIHKLVQFIENDGYKEPPYFGKEDLVGAHITVMDRSEVEARPIKYIGELGRCVFFKPLYFKEVENNEKEYYVLVIDAPLLEKIRCKYGLSKKEYPLHITIGVKEKQPLRFCNSLGLKQ